MVRLLSSRSVHFLGVLSFAIYLLHYRAGAAWQSLFNHLGGWPTWSRHVIATGCMATILIFGAWIAHLAIEKPARTLVRHLLEPRLGQVRRRQPGRMGHPRHRQDVAE